MKKTIIALTLISLGLSSLAQEGVKIASDVSPPDQSAMFEVESSSKGVLIPRVDIIDLNTAAPVSNPATSLMVYNTNTTSGVGFYYWNGSKWSNLSASQENEDWKVIGTVGTMANGEPIPSFLSGNYPIGTYEHLKIRKRTDGVVEIKGCFQRVDAVAGNILFNLPIGYRPAIHGHKIVGHMIELVTNKLGHVYVDGLNSSTNAKVYYSGNYGNDGPPDYIYYINISFETNL